MASFCLSFFLSFTDVAFLGLFPFFYASLRFIPGTTISQNDFRDIIWDILFACTFGVCIPLH